MFDLRNVYSLILLRFKIWKNSFSVFNVRFLLALISIFFASIFLFASFGSILVLETKFFLGSCILIPFLAQIIMSQRGLNVADEAQVKDNTYKLFSFFKTQPIPFPDRVLNSFLAETLFSFKFWYGSIFVFSLWLIFCKLNIFLLYSGVLVYGISYVLLSSIFGGIYALYLNSSRVIRLLGSIINLIVNIVGIAIFFGLYSFIGRDLTEQSDNFILKILNFLSAIDFDNFLVLLLLASVLFLGVIGNFLQKYFAQKYAYFIEFQDKSTNLLQTKKETAILKQSSSNKSPLSGVFQKNLRWITKFPGLLFSLIYPLFFIVIAAKFIFPYIGALDSVGYRNLYLVLSLGNFTLLADNQIAVYCKYFLFDLMHPVEIRKYFLSKFLLFSVVLALISIAFYLLNSILELGFLLDSKMLLLFLVYFLTMQTKGILLSLFDYRPMVYNERTLRTSSPGFGSSCFLTLLNYFLLFVFYIFLMLKLPYILLIAALCLALIVYAAAFYFSKSIFEEHYYDYVEKLLKD